MAAETFPELKQLIDEKIKTNGNQEITGAVLNEVLNQIVDVSSSTIGDINSILDNINGEVA